MRRREFITLVGSAMVAWPLAARAQQPDRVQRIGVLVSGTESDPENQARLAAFRQELNRFGWSEDRNVHVDYRFAATPDQFQPFARELVSLQTDVLLAVTTPATAALRRETRTVPIVFVNVSDPIGSGFIASLAHPGANLTGLLLYEEGITGKWLAMLKEIAPHLSRAALIADPTTPFDYFVRSAVSAAPSLAIEVAPTLVKNASDIKQAMESFAAKPNSGLVLLPSQTVLFNRDFVIALAAQHRLPAVYPYRPFVTAGGLMSYGVDIVEHTRQAASYVDRILRGAKPADLPVEMPTKYETVLNLKTAKLNGLEVPPTLLVRADEVIE
jgi:putative ABC transport system substrate-binding protein